MCCARQSHRGWETPQALLANRRQRADFWEEREETVKWSRPGRCHSDRASQWPQTHSPGGRGGGGGADTTMHKGGRSQKHPQIRSKIRRHAERVHKHIHALTSVTRFHFYFQSTLPVRQFESKTEQSRTKKNLIWDMSGWVCVVRHRETPCKHAVCGCGGGVEGGEGGRVGGGHVHYITSPTYFPAVYIHAYSSDWDSRASAHTGFSRLPLRCSTATNTNKNFRTQNPSHRSHCRHSP